MRPEVRAGDLRAILDVLAVDFHAEATRAIAERGSFAVALPGGSVAVNAFPVLARLPLDWRRLHFFWVDERAGPASSSESNYAMAQALWLGPANVPGESIHRMPADGPDLGVAATVYAAELIRVLGVPARLDFVLLGVGPDGHVASLFPHSTALSEERRLIAAVMDAPKPPAQRLTVTMPILASAERLVVAAFGESKAEVLMTAVECPDSSLPLAEALRRTRRPLVLADRAAASLLKASHVD